MSDTPLARFAPHPACADMSIVDRARGMVRCTPPRSKLAIVGFASNTMHLVPWLDPEYELWGLNQGGSNFLRRADRWFEMHQPEFTPDARDPGYVQFLKGFNVPCYMLDVKEEYPSSVRFPIEAAIELAGRDYFTSTIAYMLALAGLEGFKRVEVYGVNLAIGTEYVRQKDCAEWWLGFLQGRGVSIHVPRASSLLKQFSRYGYALENEPGQLTLELLKAREKEYLAICEAKLREYHVQLGALRECQALQQAIEGAQRGADIIMQPVPST